MEELGIDGVGGEATCLGEIPGQVWLTSVGTDPLST